MNLSTYLEQTNIEKWIESSYEVDGPLYWATISVLLHSHKRWEITKLTHLKRLLILAHARSCCPSGPCKSFNDKSVKSYSTYKPYLIFFGLIDGIYSTFFKVSKKLIIKLCIFNTKTF